MTRLAVRLVVGSGLALGLLSCGRGEHATGSGTGGPVDPRSLPVSCGPALASTPKVRASSLRAGYCDYGETSDHITYDLLCPPGTVDCVPEEPAGDGLCHRLCDDGKCANAEVCQARTLYVSDTPSHTAKLCMCEGGACAESPARTSTPEAGLAAWRDEMPMPVDLYYHAMAASDAHLFVSGGLHMVERNPNGSGRAELVDTLYVADLDSDGAIGAWHEPVQLAAPILNHAMAVVAGRLYLAGGDLQESFDRKRVFSDAVVSYPIAPDGSLGEPRAEAPLPEPRAWHALLVDPGDTNGATPARLIVASGAHDASFFTDGSTNIAFSPIVEPDGEVAAWTRVQAPAVFYFSGGATIAAGSLYGFAPGAYNDRSTRALWGIPLPDLQADTTPEAFTRSAAWPFDPAALSADEEVHLAGLCAQIVNIGQSGAVTTAPVDAGAGAGSFRPATRFFATSSAAAVAMTPTGRIYVSGGFGSADEGMAVRSVGPQAD